MDPSMPSSSQIQIQNHHQVQSPVSSALDDPFRTTQPARQHLSRSSSSPSSSLVVNLSLPQHARDSSAGMMPSTAMMADQHSPSPQNSSLDSHSILGMLQPRSDDHNNLYQHIGSGTPANHLHPAHFKQPSPRHPIKTHQARDPLILADGPPRSIMIDVQSNTFDNGFGHAAEGHSHHARQNSDASSSSPSPSLIRHPHQPAGSTPTPPSTNANLPELGSRSQLGQSILHHHRPSVSPSAPEPLGFLTRARTIWNQERARYRSRFESGPQIQLHDSVQYTSLASPEPHQLAQLAQLSAREMALWRWVNVDDLDSFLQEVYGYYVGKGIWAIALTRLFNLLTVGFVIGFSTFLMGCIDYSILRKSHHLEEVIVPRCVTRLSGLTLLLVLGLGGFYCWKVLRFGQEIGRLWQMHEFFTELLEVSEADIQTIPWHGLVDKLSALKHQHPSVLASADPRRIPAGGQSSTHSVLQRKLDAHDVASQIMREQNYLIALFNKDILDLRPPLPSWTLGNALIAERHLTTSLEWNLIFCLRGFLLDRRGQVKPEFLDPRLKVPLAVGLRRRFVLMSVINGVFAPFIVVYVLVYSFFRYFEEYHKNPSSIGSRSFTRLAQWKFREYNELPHLFQHRLLRSYTYSKQYMDQFPKTRTVIVAKFVSFVAGSFAAVLIVLSLCDPDAFLHFEVTRDRSVVFYIGLFGSVLAVSRGMVPRAQEEEIEQPEVLMAAIVQQTHYHPRHWHGKLHALEIYNEFCALFQLKVVNFVQELTGVLLTPFMLWHAFEIERCEQIVEFFREFTVHVEGIGYVCSFGMFDFNKLGQETVLRDRSQVPSGPPGQRRNIDAYPQYGLQQQDVSKMERSLLSFVAHHPNWEPSNQAASLYLSRAMGGSGAGSVMQPYPRLGGAGYPLRGQRASSRTGMGSVQASVLGGGTLGQSGMCGSRHGPHAARRRTSVQPRSTCGPSRRPGGLEPSLVKPSMGVEAIDEEEPAGAGEQNSTAEEDQDPFQVKPGNERAHRSGQGQGQGLEQGHGPVGLGGVMDQVLGRRLSGW